MTKHIPPQKFRKAVVLTRSERRAANTDTWVKQHLSEARDAESGKRARLKALREARDAVPSTDDATPHVTPRPLRSPGKVAS
jgi:hypothetical protein